MDLEKALAHKLRIESNWKSLLQPKTVPLDENPDDDAQEFEKTIKELIQYYKRL